MIDQIAEDLRDFADQVNKLSVASRPVQVFLNAEKQEVKVVGIYENDHAHDIVKDAFFSRNLLVHHKLTIEP